MLISKMASSNKYIGIEPSTVFMESIRNASNVSHNNNTLDIMAMGCFPDKQQHFDTIACIRNGLMTLFVTVTGLLCIGKLVQLHMKKNRALHQYFIFYCAVVECVLSGVHWMLGQYAELDFVMQYLKLVQFLMVIHFYWTLATRALRKEYLTYRVLVPIFTSALIYFTVICVLGCVRVKTSWTECFEPYWLMLSSVEFILVQLFMVAGIYLTRRLNEISTLDSVRRSQKRDIWTIICLFELSAMVGFVYDLTLRSLGDETKGCSGIFLHLQTLYSPIFGIFMLIKFMLPIWAMLIVFHPMQQSSPDKQDLLPSMANDGSYTSVFSPPRDRRKFKQMHAPGHGQGPGSYTPSGLHGNQAGALGHQSANLGSIQEEGHS